MSEQLRTQLPNPNLYTDAANEGNTAVHARAVEEVENARPLTATQDHEAIAYDVADAIKPDVDVVLEEERLKEDHNPLAAAAVSVGPGGNNTYIGVKPFERETNLVAAKADLERNARNAADIAMKQHLGGNALELAQSKQKVANMRLD